MCKRQIWRTLARFKISRFSFLRESKFQKNLDTTHFISCEDCAVQCDYAITGCPICRCAVICITKMLDWLNTIYSLLFHFSHFSLVTHFFVFGPSRDHVRITLYTFHFGQSNFLIWRLFFEHRWRNVNLTLHTFHSSFLRDHAWDSQKNKIFVLLHSQSVISKKASALFPHPWSLA